MTAGSFARTPATLHTGLLTLAFPILFCSLLPNPPQLCSGNYTSQPPLRPSSSKTAILVPEMEVGVAFWKLFLESRALWKLFKSEAYQLSPASCPSSLPPFCVECRSNAGAWGSSLGGNGSTHKSHMPVPASLLVAVLPDPAAHSWTFCYAARPLWSGLCSRWSDPVPAIYTLCMGNSPWPLTPIFWLQIH